MYFLFVNKTYSLITTEPYGFKTQIFKALFSEAKDPTDKFLFLYDLSWETKTNLQVSAGFSFSGLLTRRGTGWNYGGENYCRIPSSSGLKLYLRNSRTINFCAPKGAKNCLFCTLSIFAQSFCAKSNGARKFMGLILSWRRSLSYRNHSIDLQNKSMDWFLYDNGLHHERGKVFRFNEAFFSYIQWNALQALFHFIYLNKYKS